MAEALRAECKPDAREVGKIGRSGGSVTKPEKLSCTDPKEIHAQNRKSGLTKHKEYVAQVRECEERRDRLDSAIAERWP